MVQCLHVLIAYNIFRWRMLDRPLSIWQLRQTCQSCHDQLAETEIRLKTVIIQLNFFGCPIPEWMMGRRWWWSKQGLLHGATKLGLQQLHRLCDSGSKLSTFGSNSGQQCQNCDNGRKIICGNGCHTFPNGCISPFSSGCTGGSFGCTRDWHGAAGTVTGESLLLPGSTLITNFLNFCLEKKESFENFLLFSTTCHSWSATVLLTYHHLQNWKY